LRIALALLLGYTIFFGKATFFVWQARHDAATHPIWAIVPVALSDTSVSSARGSTLTKFGYQFDVPWKMREAKAVEGIAFFRADSGQETLEFWDPAIQTGLVEIMRDSNEVARNAMTLFYGSKFVQSDYAFEQAVLNTTPSQLSYFWPGKKDVRAAVLLMMKPIGIPESSTGIYSFETENLRGFQSGNPAKAGSVTVKAFDAQDRQFLFIWGTNPKSTGWLTQADINLVLHTLRPAPIEKSEASDKFATK